MMNQVQWGAPEKNVSDISWALPLCRPGRPCHPCGACANPPTPARPARRRSPPKGPRSCAGSASAARDGAPALRQVDGPGSARRAVHGAERAGLDAELDRECAPVHESDVFVGLDVLELTAVRYRIDVRESEQRRADEHADAIVLRGIERAFIGVPVDLVRL